VKTQTKKRNFAQKETKWSQTNEQQVKKEADKDQNDNKKAKKS
jgi:hypothetical protein